MKNQLIILQSEYEQLFNNISEKQEEYESRIYKLQTQLGHQTLKEEDGYDFYAEAENQALREDIQDRDNLLFNQGQEIRELKLKLNLLNSIDDNDLETLLASPNTTE